MGGLRQRWCGRFAGTCLEVLFSKAGMPRLSMQRGMLCLDVPNHDWSLLRQLSLCYAAPLPQVEEDAPAAAAPAADQPMADADADKASRADLAGCCAMSA